MGHRGQGRWRSGLQAARRQGPRQRQGLQRRRQVPARRAVPRGLRRKHAQDEGVARGLLDHQDGNSLPLRDGRAGPGPGLQRPGGLSGRIEGGGTAPRTRRSADRARHATRRRVRRGDEGRAGRRDRPRARLRAGVHRPGRDTAGEGARAAECHVARGHDHRRLHALRPGRPVPRGDAKHLDAHTHRRADLPEAPLQGPVRAQGGQRRRARSPGRRRHCRDEADRRVRGAARHPDRAARRRRRPHRPRGPRAPRRDPAVELHRPGVPHRQPGLVARHRPRPPGPHRREQRHPRLGHPGLGIDLDPDATAPHLSAEDADFFE